MLKSASILLTLACPVECEHCQYSCTAGKDPEKWQKPEILDKFCREAKSEGIEDVHITGGEPLYDINKFIELTKIITKYFKPPHVSLASSGFWAVDEKNTKRFLSTIEKFNITELYVSIDRFHIKRVPLKNIENILKYSKEFNINVHLRPTIDNDTSDDLIKKIINIIKKYKVEINLSITEFIGRAEFLPKKDIGRSEKLIKFINELHQKNENNVSNNNKLPKTAIILTLFPDGNVYSCCVGAKGSFLGNVKEMSIREILKNFSKSLHSIAYKKGCHIFKLFSSPLDRENCDFCKTIPLKNIEKIKKYYVGRRYVVIDPSTDIEKKFDDIRNEWRELLVSVQPKEELNHIFGKKVEEFIKLLIKYNKRFVFSRPIPSCLGIDKNLLKKFDDYQLPKNCWECRELFTVENGNFVACPNIFNINLGSINEFGDRKEIYDKFMEERGKINGGLISKKCKGCIFRIRNNCGCNGVKK